ncbi:hypothetical protein Q4493_04275 [Colwellia sp. 1_MG-2023]|uniref:hypothetical protein n=1 Tax=Colwellia sp. 1_MG-2023 TaxID=3062649 RepID=UPI0026E2CFA8|nr:hypothetical protein [Colwellia sp. 1_MG-2023]MDO6444986.1 hypothetical protein [Colwellia sp. 1_MG-2023]
MNNYFKKILIIDLVIFILSLLIFSWISFNVSTDINLHAEMIRKISDKTILPPANFLYYLTVYFFSFFETNIDNLLFSSIFTLTIALTAKFILTRKIFQYYNQNNKEIRKNSYVFILLPSILLLFVFSLPASNYYLGQIPPNVWHNSTTILVMPFSLALFFLSYLQLIKPSNKRISTLVILCLLNILIKPSYFFVFAMVFPLLLLKTFKFNNAMWRNLIPVFIGTLTTLILYYLIYSLSYGNQYADKASIIIKPFSVWSYFTPNILYSLVASLVFPIIYIGFYWRDVFKNLLLQYATISYLVAISLTALLSETGAREYHGNFFWQSTICSYILFLVTTLLFVEKVAFSGLKPLKNKVILGAFLLHFLAGIAYLIKIFNTHNYI